jgi:hypothetical protein
VGEVEQSLKERLVETLVMLEALPPSQRALVFSGLVGLVIGAAAEQRGISDDEATAWVLDQVAEQILEAVTPELGDGRH